MKITVPLILFGVVAGVSSFIPKLADWLLWVLVAGAGLTLLVGVLVYVVGEIRLHIDCVRPNPSWTDLPPPVYHPNSPHARKAKEPAGE